MLSRPVKILLLASGLFSISAASYAIEPGVYFGAGYGATNDVLLEERDNGSRIFGGINLTQNIGFEVAYVDLGEYANGVLTQEAVTFELVGYLPLSYSLDIYGKFGLAEWEVSDNIATETGDDVVYGIGANIWLAPNVSLRGEWENFVDVSGGDVEMYSANLSINF